MPQHSHIRLLTVIMVVFSQGYCQGSNIVVQTMNGRIMIALDGVSIDLARANKLSEDNQQVVLSPVEVRGAIIKINKPDNQVTIDYNGAHYQTVKPEEVASFINQQSGAIFNTISQSMGDMTRNMQAMTNNMFNAFRFPF